METSLLTALQGAGFNKKEAKIYLALLELGEATVTQIAEKSDLRRTTLYPILEELAKKSLIYTTKIKNKTFYIADDPEAILKDLENRRIVLAEKLSELQSLSTAQSSQSKVLFFSGTEGFKKIWDIVFTSGIKEFLIITDPREFKGFVKNRYITQSIIKKKIAQGIQSRQLVAASEDAKAITQKDGEENRQSRMLPHQYKLPFTTIIFDNSVALISPSPENIILIIQSEAYAKTERSLFEALWESLN